MTAEAATEGTVTLPFWPEGQLACLGPAELIDLMVGAEDRVPRALIDACVRHGEEMVSVLARLDAPPDPDDGDSGRWWLRLHAIMILGLIPSAAAGLLMVRLMRRMAEADDVNLQDWLAGYWPALFANKPEAAIEAVRDVASDREIDWYIRANALDPVLAAAERRGPKALDDALDWVAAIAADEGEDWEMRLSCGNALLDFPRAHHRSLVDALAALQKDRFAKFHPADVEEAYAEGDSPGWHRRSDPWEFYRPERIAARQQRWAQEDREGEDEGSDDGLFGEGDDLFDEAGSTYVRKAPKVGRNDPCPCGSGKKYKKCCLDRLT